MGGKHPLDEELGCLHNWRNPTNKRGMTHTGKPPISFECIIAYVVRLAWALFSLFLTII